MDISRIKERLRYEPRTGDFTWDTGRKAGCRKAEGYVVIRVDGTLEYAHRIAWAYVHGQWPSAVIDHINGNRSDNRIANLRDVPVEVNTQNQRDLVKPMNLSGFKGVQRNHSGWQAVIQSAGGRLCLGTFRDPLTAHQVYVEAKRKLHAGFVL